MGEIGHAEIENDICDLGTETAADSELSGWLGRQIDTCDLADVRVGSISSFLP
jgi:hypothetical protein